MVSCGHYIIVGDNLAHNSWKTILMVGTIGSVVKTVKHELEVDNILFQCYDALASSIFIELFNSSLSEDLTPLPSLMKLSKKLFNPMSLCC